MKTPHVTPLERRRSGLGIDCLIDAGESGAADLVAEVGAVLGIPSPQYISRDGGDVTLSPALLARLLRAARGERVLVGRVVFNPEAVDPLERRDGAA